MNRHQDGDQMAALELRNTVYQAAAFMALLGKAMSILLGLARGILCKVATTPPTGG
jgi:hypothetical protein